MLPLLSQFDFSFLYNLANYNLVVHTYTTTQVNGPLIYL